MASYRISPDADHSHTGDLVDHSLWTYYFLPVVFQPWYILIIWCYKLLDYFMMLGNQEMVISNISIQTGQDYFRGRPYYWGGSAGQDLMSYLQRNCGLTLQEWTLVQIIVGLHYDLGNYFQHLITAEQLFDPIMV
jgi:hypothetical protein